MSRPNRRTVAIRVARAALATAAAALLLAVGGPASAQSGADLERAEATATEAKALFQNKVYGEAATLFMKAYAISKRPTLVYNAARAYQELGRHKRAESLFLMYRGLPGVDAAGREDADRRLASVRAAMKKAPPTPSGPAKPGKKPATIAPAPAPPPGRPLPWLRLSFAGVALVGAGVAYLQARSIASGLDAGDVRTDAQAAAYRQDRDTALNLRNAAIGAAAVGAGLGIWALASMSGDGETKAARASLSVLPAPRGLLLSARF